MQAESHEDYETAVTTCEDMGAYLFYAKTRTEFNSFMSLNPKYTEWYGEFQQFLAFSDLFSLPGIKRESPTSSNWLNSEGGTTSYKNWKYGEPNNSYSNEGCAEIQMATTYGRNMNDIRCDGSKPFTCFKTVAVGEEYSQGDETCTCTSDGVVCRPSYTCTYFDETLNAGESVVEADENRVCECTENGMQCQTLSECPEFIKMDGEKTYAEAKAECAELDGFVAFFKDESEHAKYLEEDVTRKEWMGKYPLLIYFT